MSSRAVKDYLRSFRLKQLVSAENALLYIYLLIGPSYFFNLPGEEARVFSLAVYYCGMIPLILGMSGMRLNPIGMPKIMFLCPMSRQQREEYVRAKFWARFYVPALLFAVVRIVLWMLYPAQIYFLLLDCMLIFAMLGASFMTLTGRNLAMEATVNQPKLLKEKEMKGIDVKGLISFLIGILAWVVASAGVTDDGEIHIAVWIVTVLLLIWQIWLSAKMFGSVKYLIPLACNYERMNV